MSWHELPTLSELQETRRAVAKGAIPSRLSEKTAKDQTEKQRAVDLARAVWKKYEGKCHVCGVKVMRSLERHSKRGEIHHRQTRGAHPEAKHELDNLVLLCALCHEKAQRHQIRVPA